GGVPGVFGNHAGHGCIAGGDVEQFTDRGPPRKAEDLLVHTIEQPAEAGYDQHEPVIAIELAVPGRRGHERYCLTGRGLRKTASLRATAPSKITLPDQRAPLLFPMGGNAARRM